MGAREAFERCFRELVMEKPYSKITVTEICRKVHLSRKTFYDNFQDNFEHNIMKKVQEVSAEMELFSDYIKKQCEIQRMYKANKYR